ncbi:transposase [Dysosmobacter welbionis]
MIPEDAPVRLVSVVLEELNNEELYCVYFPLGRKSADDPQVMFEVLAYGCLCGIYSSRKQEEACRYRIDFMWLLGDEKVPDYSTFGLVPYKSVPGSAGGPVLPPGWKARGHGRNRLPYVFHRRDQTGEPYRTVHLRAEKERGRVPGQGEEAGTQGDGFDLPSSLAVPSG